VAPVPQAQEANNQALSLLSRPANNSLAKNPKKEKKNLKRKRKKEQRVEKKKAKVNRAKQERQHNSKRV
jgi:hypothetical protein